MLKFFDHQLIQGDADGQGRDTDGKEQEKDVFPQFGLELFLYIVQSEIGDQDSGDLLFRFMAGETLLLIVNRVNISEDFFPLGRGINHCLIECLRSSTVADLAGGITTIDDTSYFFIIGGNNNSASSIEDEDVLHIRVLMDGFKDMFHLVLVFR